MVKLQAWIYEEISPANPGILDAEGDDSSELSTQETTDHSGYMDAEAFHETFELTAELIKSTLAGEIEPEPGIDDMNLVSGLGEAANLSAAAAKNLMTQIKTAKTALAAKDAMSQMPRGRLTKTELAQEKKNFLDQIIAKGAGELRVVGVRRGATRLSFTDAKKDITSIIGQVLRGTEIKTVAAKQFALGATSSKYTTYFVSLPKPILARLPEDPKVEPWVKVVFTAGANKGQKYEVAFKEAIASRTGPEWDALTAKLFEFFGAGPEDVLEVEGNVGGGLHVSRSFNSRMLNLGPVLSDMNLTVQTPEQLPEKVYVSIKDTNGTTITNNGYTGGFARNEQGLITPAGQGSLIIEHFLESLGVNKERIASGLNDYEKQQRSSTEFLERTKFDARTVVNYIAAQIAYGYIYVRNDGKGGLKILDFTDPGKVLDFVGMPRAVVVRYPHFLAAKAGSASKQCSIVVETSTNKFLIEVRNSQGGLIPNQINLRTHS